MTHGSIVHYLNPWKLQREKARRQLEALRGRDGDNCRRCRRPLRFDLPQGHDQAPTVQTVPAAPAGAGGPLDTLCLCHTRCNTEAADNTVEVQERLRQRAAERQAEPARKRRKRAA